ncbi:cobyrinate a,c-diamide synthase [Curtanaerobium respiraculi]|uniref:cobyrinate a,c-diamide synthase n=1 Tax=Curtanaerobium respiraculi TaxID=2949669 RepID=UPI0024B343ED|nr:cobyrinate a,c-diamide synthase [Curtanaerobium respiraculi]
MTGEILSLPRVMIAASHGKSGKTILVSGILRALKKRGVDVQPFKKGPDYIDPGWHSLAAGRPCRNLDSLFMDEDAMHAVLLEASAGARLELIEGAMGLFDGSDVQGSSSSAEVAKQTKTPVVLVMDVTRMTRTAAALLKGCMEFDDGVHVVGVILNRIRGARHEARIRESIEHYCGIPIIGAVPEDARLVLPDRHLGLVTSVESDSAESFLDGVADVIEEHVDIDLLIRVAAEAEPIVCPTADDLYGPGQSDAADPVTIAVVRDRSFEFYYPENLKALERAGARLAFVDSMEDNALPADASGLYIGGGFPEVFAPQLQENACLRADIKSALDRGMACFAECGGLMYLARTLTVDGVPYEMVGALDIDIEMKQKRQAHGYAHVVVRDEHPWLPAGTAMMCHEHHHSRASRIGEGVVFGLENMRGKGISGHLDGVCYKRTCAGYAHVNAIASPAWAPAFVAAAREFETEGDRGGEVASKRIPLPFRYNTSVCASMSGSFPSCTQLIP